MAGKDLTYSVTEVDFSLKVSNISKLTRFQSPHYVVQGMPWYVSIEKENFLEKPALSAYLYCSKKEKSNDWSAVARCTIKLVPFDESKEPIESGCNYSVFDHNVVAFGLSNFIEWDELIDAKNAYLKDDSINLAIKIEVADPNDKNKSGLIFDKVETCCDEDCVSAYRMTVTNITSLLAVNSPEISMRKQPWYLSVHKKDDALSVQLMFITSHTGITCKSKMTIKLKSSKDETKSIQKVQEKTFESCTMLTISLLSWDELLNPQYGFVNNSSIEIEVEIKTSKPDGVGQNDLAANPESKRKKLECPICSETLEKLEIFSTLCGHLFCKTCIIKAINDRKACPSCNAATTLKQTHRVYLPFNN